LQVTGYRVQGTGFGTAFSVQRTAFGTAFGGGVGCGVEVEGGIGGGRGFGVVLGWLGRSGRIGASAGGVLFAFANAFSAGSPAGLAAAVEVSETAGASFDGRELAADIELGSRVANAVTEIVEEAACVVVALLDFVVGEPAGGREIFGASDEGLVEPLAVLVEKIFVEGPGGLGGIGGAPGLVGAEEFAVGSGDDFADGLREGNWLIQGFGARGGGAGEGEGSDLADEGEGAGVAVVNEAGEDAVGGLGEDELDGGVVLEEGHDNFEAAHGALGVAIVQVSVAEVVAAEGGGVALESVDSEGAAAAAFFGRGGGGFGGRGGGGGHSFPFTK
jgi:hypothetical protein